MPNKTQKEQIEMVRLWRRSGLKKEEFCERNNISRTGFYYWIKKYNDNDFVNNVSQIKFLNVPKYEDPKSLFSETNNLEVSLPNGVSFKAKMSYNNMVNLIEELLKWK